ncbi:MAG: hypothetical protein AB7U73_14840 [Pirellulales bacterium]
MPPRKKFDNPTFAFVAKGLVDLHRLIKAGQEDSPEAEAIRDALDGPLAALNPVEKLRAQWLSEDLYSISEPVDESALKPMNPQAQQRISEFSTARQRSDWDQALSVLRRWQGYISPALLSFLRGSIWFDAGVAVAAAAFLEHASQRDPANYRAVHLLALGESDAGAAEILAREILKSDDQHSSDIVAQAAGICVKAAIAGEAAMAEQTYRSLLPVLDRTLKRPVDDDAIASRSTAAYLALLLGLCHEKLGGTNAAIDHYTRGLQADPFNEALLIARGNLLYGRNPSAIGDFRHAVESESTFIWPYLFLAHEYLATHQYDLCRTMCERGLHRDGSDQAKSHLEEWRAIAQCELGFSPELVRTAFESAIRLDPANENARRNLARFNEAWTQAARPQHLSWEQKSAAEVRNFGLAERQLVFADWHFLQAA